MITLFAVQVDFMVFKNTFQKGFSRLDIAIVLVILVVAGFVGLRFFGSQEPVFLIVEFEEVSPQIAGKLVPGLIEYDQITGSQKAEIVDTRVVEKRGTKGVVAILKIVSNERFSVLYFKDAPISIGKQLRFLFRDIEISGNVLSIHKSQNAVDLDQFFEPVYVELVLGNTSREKIRDVQVVFSRLANDCCALEDLYTFDRTPKIAGGVAVLRLNAFKQHNSLFFDRQKIVIGNPLEIEVGKVVLSGTISALSREPFKIDLITRPVVVVVETNPAVAQEFFDKTRLVETSPSKKVIGDFTVLQQYPKDAGTVFNYLGGTITCRVTPSGCQLKETPGDDRLTLPLLLDGGEYNASVFSADESTIDLVQAQVTFLVRSLSPWLAETINANPIESFGNTTSFIADTVSVRPAQTFLTNDQGKVILSTHPENLELEMTGTIPLIKTRIGEYVFKTNTPGVGKRVNMVFGDLPLVSSEIQSLIVTSE
jgi:hypothetical protein